MEQKFLVVYFNNWEYGCLEYLYTKEINDIKKVENDILDDIINSWFDKKDDFSFKWLLSL